MMAAIVATRVVEHLELCGLVAMKKPPIGGPLHLAVVMTGDDAKLFAREPLAAHKPVVHESLWRAALLAAIVARWEPDRAFTEFVGARPGEGAAGPSRSAALEAS